MSENYKNRKSFLFKTAHGNPFIAIFVVDEASSQILGKAIGANVFPNANFTPVFSINQAVNWLKEQGHTYIKRLPVPQYSRYASSKHIAMFNRCCTEVNASV